MRTYIGAIEKEKDIYTVQFPDLPGCLAEGDSFEQACVEAQQALSLYLSEAAARGIDVPAPTDPTKLSKKEFARQFGELHAAITAPAEPGERERVNVIFDKNLLVAVDTLADAKGENRSSFLETAARMRLANELATVFIEGETAGGKAYRFSGGEIIAGARQFAKNTLSAVMQRETSTGRLTSKRSPQSPRKAKV